MACQRFYESAGAWGVVPRFGFYVCKLLQLRIGLDNKLLWLLSSHFRPVEKFRKPGINEVSENSLNRLSFQRLISRGSFKKSKTRFCGLFVSPGCVSPKNERFWEILVVVCKYNPQDLQTSLFSAQIICQYPGMSTHISWQYKFKRLCVISKILSNFELQNVFDTYIFYV